jgi:hypothetical protein
MENSEFYARLKSRFLDAHTLMNQKLYKKSIEQHLRILDTLVKLPTIDKTEMKYAAASAKEISQILTKIGHHKQSAYYKTIYQALENEASNYYKNGIINTIDAYYHEEPSTANDTNTVNSDIVILPPY